MKNIVKAMKRRKSCIAISFCKLFLLATFLSFSLVCGATAQNSGNGQMNEITLKLEHVTLKEALRELEKTTKCQFFYNSTGLDLNKKVSLSVDKVSFEQILSQILPGFSYKKEDNTIYLIPADNKTVKVKGKVLDETKQPAVGATIQGKNADGSKKVVVTDVDGIFSIEVPAGSFISVSYIGFKTKEIKVVKAVADLNVELEPSSTDLDELVVVGYGTQKKISVTGAIASVSQAELKTAPAGNLSGMLQGRLPGLITKQSSGKPGEDGTSLLVRGLATMGDNGPLVVVDGIPRSFPDISPEEVESITILKDATSAAIYGVRAANGVILITTKRGENQKPTVSFTTSMSLSQNTNFPKFLNAKDYAYWYDKAQRMDGIAESALRFTPDEIARISNPNGDPMGEFADTDWFGMLFKKTAPSYNNIVTLNGGGDKYRFFISLGAYNQRGVVERTSYDRYNLRANLDADVTSNVKLSVGLAANQNKTKEPGLEVGTGNKWASVYSQVLMSYPFLPAYKDDLPVGSMNPINGDQNGIAARDLSGDRIRNGSAFQGNISLTYEIPKVKGLSIKGNAAYDRSYSVLKASLMPYKLNVYNASTKSWEVTNARHLKSGEPQLNQWFADVYTATLQGFVNYDNKFGKHDVKALLLYEYTQDGGSSMSNGKKGFPITNIMDMSYGEEVIESLVQGGHTLFKRAGYVGRVNYAFDDKYLFEFTARLDGSPKLPKKNRWGFFPGVALGWRISSEEFFSERVTFLENMKIRASVGKLGNDAIGDYAYIRTMGLTKDPTVMFGDDAVRSLYVNGVPNDNITWESTTSYNIGLDASLRKGLLGLELDVFYMHTTDILQSQSGLKPPSMGGYYPATINSGIVDNKGFELTLTHRYWVSDFNYGIRGNVSWARNKVIKTTESPNQISALKATGHPMGRKFGYQSNGIFQTEGEIKRAATTDGETLPGHIRLVDQNGDGRITWDKDRLAIGRSATPEMMFGFNVDAQWRGFDFNMFWQGAALYDVALGGYYSDRGFYDDTFYTRPFYNDGNTPYYLVEGAWTPDNTNAKYPRLSTMDNVTNGGKMSDWWIINGAYLRLKNVQIGYTLPMNLTKKIEIQKVRFYVSGSNLVTFSHMKYLDPEMPDVNQGYYPQQRVFEFGLNLTF